MTEAGEEKRRDAEGNDLDAALRRGALVNAFGVVAKLSFPIFFLVVTWTLGPAITGVFSLAFFAGELLRGFVVGGYMDGVTIYASRAIQRPEDGVAPERVLGAALGTSFLLATGAAVLCWPVVDWLVGSYFSEYADLGIALRLVLLSLPALAVLNVSLAGTKARMLMHYEILVNGLARPVALTVSAVVAALTETGLAGLMAGYLVSHVLLAGLGLVALGRCFELKAVFRGLRGKRVRALHDYAIPQSFNLTLNNYQTRIDAWLLGAFATPATLLALYTTAALITSSLREIRMVFSSSLAPVAARHHAAEDTDALEEVFNRISRWTTSLVFPVIFTVMLFRDDILVAIDEAYAADTSFMLILLIAPLSSCAIGLAGNCVGFTGHSRWNLFNAMLVSIINTAVSLALIPRFGLVGAAIGTAVASVTLNLAELIEIRLLEDLRLRPRALFYPYVAVLPIVLLVITFWDPGQLPLLWRGGLFGAGIVAYLGVLRLLGMPELRRGPESAPTSSAGVTSNR